MGPGSAIRLGARLVVAALAAIAALLPTTTSQYVIIQIMSFPFLLIDNHPTGVVIYEASHPACPDTGRCVDVGCLGEPSFAIGD